MALDRRGLEQGHAVDIDAVAVFHDPSWERLVIQQNGDCVAVDATGIERAIPYGDRVRVSGFTAFERHGPMIVLPRVVRLPARGERTWKPLTSLASLVPESGVACLEVQARVRAVRQIDSEHLSLQASVDGGELEGIVMDIANSALLSEGDAVVLRGPVEAIAAAGHESNRWRIYLQGEGAFERLDGAPRPPRAPTAPQAEHEVAPLSRLLQIKMLTPQEAGRGLPVRVRGVVTGASARASNGAQEIILQDADCGLYATTETPTEGAALGALVEIEGRTAPGAFSPIVVYSALRVLDKAPLPEPLPAAELDAGLSSRTENAWTVMKGVLRPQADNFAVATPDVELPLFFFTGDAGSLTRLIDAEVEVSGVYAVIHRARRVVGYRLLVQSPDQISLLRLAADPGSTPVYPISQLFTYWPSGRPLHRIAIRGAVTGVFHPDLVYVDDGTAGVLSQTAARPPIGAVVTASGFLPVSGPEHRLTRADLRESAERAAPPDPRILTIEEVFGGESDGRLVRMVGRLRERTRSLGREWLTLEANERTVSAVLELPAPRQEIDDLRIGSELRVTGIAEMDWDRSRVPPRVRAARLLLRSPDDIELLRAASWWSRERVVGLMVPLLVFAAIPLVWVALLRRRAGQQTN